MRTIEKREAPKTQNDPAHDLGRVGERPGKTFEELTPEEYRALKKIKVEAVKKDGWLYLFGDDGEPLMAFKEGWGD